MTTHPPGPDPGLDPPPASSPAWRSLDTLSLAEVAAILRVTRPQVSALIDDWAFGDPAHLPDVGVGSRPILRIPAERVRRYVDHGDRGYPPGDPRGARGGTP